MLKAGSTEFDRTYEIPRLSPEQGEAINPYIRGVEPVSDELFRITTMQTGIPQRVINDNNISINEVYNYQVKTNLTLAGAEELRKNKGVIDSVVRVIYPKSKFFGPMFPKGTSNWSVDNFGPIYIPEEGKTVALTPTSLKFYKKIIKEYEGHDLKVTGDVIRIDGKVVTNYTFGQNYYWMMGDNRHNSEDSRYWGFVPENHVVGKPVFIWLSIDQNKSGFDKIRWERMFTTVGGDGEPVSYFKIFLILLALYFVATFFLNKRKDKRLKA